MHLHNRAGTLASLSWISYTTHSYSHMCGTSLFAKTFSYYHMLVGMVVFCQIFYASPKAVKMQIICSISQCIKLANCCLILSIGWCPKQIFRCAKCNDKYVTVAIKSFAEVTFSWSCAKCKCVYFLRVLILNLIFNHCNYSSHYTCGGTWLNKHWTESCCHLLIVKVNKRLMHKDYQS